jgi:gliding motility-associated lipoprotein GldH
LPTRKMILPGLMMHADTNKKNILLFKRTGIVFLFLVLGVSFSSCDRNMVFDNNKTLADAGWNSSDIVKFNVPIADTAVPYNFYLNIRVTTEYKFANLFLYMKTLYPNGQISIDTIECFLADIDGRWLGSRSGKIIDNRILFRKNMKYPLFGTYSFEFEQAMRDSVLTNVENFGIRIEKAE